MCDYQVIWILGSGDLRGFLCLKVYFTSIVRYWVDFKVTFEQQLIGLKKKC